MKRKQYERRYSKAPLKEGVAEDLFKKYPIWLGVFDDHFPESTYIGWFERLPAALQPAAERDKKILVDFIAELSKNVSTSIGVHTILAPAYIGRIPAGMTYQILYQAETMPGILFLTKKEWAVFLTAREPKK